MWLCHNGKLSPITGRARCPHLHLPYPEIAATSGTETISCYPWLDVLNLPSVCMYTPDRGRLPAVLWYLYVRDEIGLDTRTYIRKL